MAKEKKDGVADDAKKRDEYNRGDFLTTDPVTGEPRGKTGGNWQSEEDLAEYNELTAGEDAEKPKSKKKADKNDPDFG